MILLWLKIIYYKITKPAPRRDRTGTGTAPHTGARATGETSPEVSFSIGVDPATRDGLVLYARENGRNTATTARLKELIDRGLVSLPFEGDVYRLRMDRLEADHARREQEARTDVSRCPCGGRHYPEPTACRWCRCHDPDGVFHMAPEVVEQIRLDMARQPSAESIRDSYRPCARCGDAAHAGVICPSRSESPVRPSDEIESCRVCGHPHHPLGDRRCVFSVPSGEPSGGIESCRCDGSRILEDGS
jgi:hypothetical protein